MSEISGEAHRMPDGGAKGREDRWRSIVAFVVSAIWMLLAFRLSRGFTHSVPEQYAGVVQELAALLLLLGGFAVISMVLEHQQNPLIAMGLGWRSTTKHEIGLGLAVGWGMVVVLVLPMMLAGRLHTSLFWEAGEWWLLLTNFLLLAFGAMAEEIAFRGYPFQRLIESMGDAWATVLMTVVFGLVHLQNPYASLASTLVTILGGVLFSIAYLRTRSLWLPWGLHLGWNVSLGLLFGLPVSGVSEYSSVVQTIPGGPGWLTGLDYGPEGSLLAVLVLFAGIAVLVRATRNLAWKYNAPVIVAGGFPMDVAPPKEHTRMEEQAAAAPALVQIMPSTPQGFSKTDGQS